MAATVTLATTTLVDTLAAGEAIAVVASTSDLAKGLGLWIDRELLAVASFGPGTSVTVRRGVGGTASSAHSSGATVTIGRLDQFYETDPIGIAPIAVPVSPWINVITGDVWTAQGDEAGADATLHYWTKNETTHGTTAFGSPATTVAPSVTTQY